MVKKTLFFVLIAMAMSFVACNRTNSDRTAKDVRMDNPRDENVLADGTAAQSAADYVGTYEGVLPCASCEGIETTVVLRSDSTYVITTNYLGEESSNFEEEGNFTISMGNIVTLEGITGGSNKYLIGENQLKHLDMEGNEITGALAEKYVLKRK